MPTQNIGTLVGAAIRPIDDTSKIASAFAFEINGGHHQVATLAVRNLIMVQRRQWGMLCTVYNDSTVSNNATYQLKYGHFSTNTEDNQNWVVFSGGGGASSVGAGSGAGWFDPVMSIQVSAPTSPDDGDRYLVGKNSSESLSGYFTSLTNVAYSGTLVGGYIAEYSDSLSTWITTLPNDGTTLRVNDEDNSFYRYEGTYSTGQWYKERVNQVRHLYANSTDNINYDITVPDYFTYSTESVYMVQFGTSNSGMTASLDINGLGYREIRLQTKIGLQDFAPSDINVANIYTMVYDGSQFRINIPSGSSTSGGFELKYRIVPGERIYVPPYSEYLLYGNLEVNGDLDISSTGKVVILNGALNVNGGTVTNGGNVELVSFATQSLSKFTQVLSPMTAGTTYSITHNLATPSPMVNTWNEDTGELISVVAIKKTDNTMDVSSSTTLSNVRIVVI